MVSSEHGFSSESSGMKMLSCEKARDPRGFRSLCIHKHHKPTRYKVSYYLSASWHFTGIYSVEHNFVRLESLKYDEMQIFFNHFICIYTYNAPAGFITLDADWTPPGLSPPHCTHHQWSGWI